MTHRGPFQPLLFCDSVSGISDSVLAFRSLPDPHVRPHRVTYRSPKADVGVITSAKDTGRVRSAVAGTGFGEGELGDSAGSSSAAVVNGNLRNQQVRK